MPPLVMLIRHAEKPLGDGPPHGVTVDGTHDPESLTPRGWQRAGALVGLFAPDHAAGTRSRLPTPTHLVASRIGSGSTSQRPRETLLPLGERLGLAIDSRFRKDELGALVGAIGGLDQVVLVAWEHHLIPSLASLLLGDPSGVPPVWPDDRYDVVWVIEETAPPGGRRLCEVPQMLLAGDQPGTIGPAGRS
jgi:hypothetical protein